MTSIPDHYLEISSVLVGQGGGRSKGFYLTPERQEVPTKRLSLYPSLVGAKAQQESQTNQRELEPFAKGGALGLMDSLIFEDPEVSG